jgi:cytochrome c
MDRHLKSALAVFGAACGLAALANAQVPPSTQTASPAAANALVGDAEAGAEIYANDCKGCHSVSIGPSLRGVIGRPIASVAAYTGYSEGLKGRAGGSWDLATLDVYLASPEAFAPGSLMTKSLADAQARADVIAYLATLPPPRQ